MPLMLRVLAHIVPGLHVPAGAMVALAAHHLLAAAPVPCRRGSLSGRGRSGLACATAGRAAAIAAATNIIFIFISCD